MTTVQIFLMGFGAVLAVIGVIVFFLLAWFKETTGQEHHNAIKILQAEFRFSNPALVIFAGGLLLMVAPFFLDQAPPAAPAAGSGNSETAPTNTRIDPPPPTTNNNTPVTSPPGSPVIVEPPVIEPPPPALDVAGRWRNQDGFLEIRSRGDGALSYTDFDRAGNQVGRGTGWQIDEFVYLDGEGLIFDAFGNPVHIEYSANFELDGAVLEGDLFDVFGNYLGSVSFTRDAGGS